MTISSEIKTESIIPGVILIFFMTVGLIGNVHVILVYAFRLKPTNHRIYIIFLSIQDISLCIIFIPLTVDAYINSWTYSSDTRCKFLSFMAYLIHVGSVFTLLLIAVDRYRKICRPHEWQIKKHVAKRLCFIAVISACFCSWPVLVFYEVKTVAFQNTTITICDAAYGDMNYELYYFVLLAVIVFGDLGILVILYACILRAVSKYQSKENVQCGKGQLNDKSCQVLNRSTKMLELTPSTAHIDYLCCENIYNTVEGKTKSKEESSEGCSSDQIKSKTPNVNPQRRNRARKITLAFILITMFYCVTYIPFFSLKILLAQKQFSLTPFTRSIDLFIASRVVSLCLYINYMANCFIYGCFDRKFRNGIVNIYKRLCCRN